MERTISGLPLTMEEKVRSTFGNLPPTQISYLLRTLELLQARNYQCAKALAPEVKSSLDPVVYGQLLELIASLESSAKTFDEGLATLFASDSDSDSGDDSNLLVRSVSAPGHIQEMDPDDDSVPTQGCS